MLSGGTIAPREIGVASGRVAAICELGADLPGAEIFTLAPDEILVPGLVDAHVHVNEPGRTEWEGFASATRAAAAGGTTTLIDMPLNSVPSTINEPALFYKQLVAAGQLYVDTGFWGGAVPGNRDDLLPLHRAGVFGFKCFLADSGVPEFPPLNHEQLEEYLPALAGFGGLLIVHAEDAETLAHAPSAFDSADYDRFLSSRPPEAELRAIEAVVSRVRRSGARSHILHLSAGDALKTIAAAKSEGLDISAETCPHYLTLTADEIPPGGTTYKCCPPIREPGNADRLWQGLLDGTIDYIASDHSPATADTKNGGFDTAWGGIASLQLSLPLVWTEARRRGIGLERVVDWMATRPARRLGLADKGDIAIGSAADFAVFVPEESFTVDAARLEHKNSITPYHGRTLFGIVRRTYLHGRAIDRNTPTGRIVTPGMT